MPAISNLYVSLTARTKPFTRNMKNARRSLTVFSHAVAAARTRMIGLFAAAGVGLSIYGLGAIIKGAAESIDKVSKLSDVLNISTKNLYGLQYAAQISGASAENMNKALEIFVRRIGEATQGSGEATRGLELLGLKADVLARMDTADALKLVADRINMLPDAAQRGAAAYYMLGRGGMNLAKLLMAGSDGIQGMIDKADLFGNTLSRIEGAQVEAMNDSITDLKQLWEGITKQLTVALAPVVTDIAHRIVEWATAGGGVRERVQEIIEKVIGVIDWADRANTKFQIWLLKSRQAVALFIGTFAKGFATLHVVFKVAFKALTTYFDRLIIGIVNKFGWAIDAVLNIARKVPGVKGLVGDMSAASIAEGFQSNLDAANKGIKDAMDEERHGQAMAISNAMDSYYRELDSKIAELEKRGLTRLRDYYEGVKQSSLEAAQAIVNTPAASLGEIPKKIEEAKKAAKIPEIKTAKPSMPEIKQKGTSRQVQSISQLALNMGPDTNTKEDEMVGFLRQIAFNTRAPVAVAG